MYPVLWPLMRYVTVHAANTRDLWPNKPKQLMADTFRINVRGLSSSCNGNADSEYGGHGH